MEHQLLRHCSRNSLLLETRTAAKVSIEDQFHRLCSSAHNEARALFDSGRLREVIRKAQEFLDEAVLPRYHRVRTLLLLSTCVKSWQDTQDCLDKDDIRDTPYAAFTQRAKVRLSTSRWVSCRSPLMRCRKIRSGRSYSSPTSMKRRMRRTSPVR